MNASSSVEELAREILSRAADAFEAEPGRWIQGVGSVQGLDGLPARACVLGLVRLGGRFPDGRNPNPRPRSETFLAAAEMLDRQTGNMPTVDWNDSPDRTVEEVVAALRAAAGDQ